MLVQVLALAEALKYRKPCPGLIVIGPLQAELFALQLTGAFQSAAALLNVATVSAALGARPRPFELANTSPPSGTGEPANVNDCAGMVATV